jgi:acetoacetyl-CoA reductase
MSVTATDPAHAAATAEPRTGCALVTGASRGIGAATARALADDGWAIAVNYSRDREGAESVASQIEEGGGAAVVLGADVANPAAAEEMLAELAGRLGPVLVLVNNAGVTADGTFRKMTFERWNKVIDTNLNSLFHVTKQVIDGMLDRGWGRIINISSVNGQKGQFGQTNYSTAKAGIRGFTMALAQEVASKGVTVNTISPGYIGTDMVRAMKPEVLTAIVGTIPVGRLGTPEEIASMVAWLASDDAAFATGADFSLNGGLHMS